MRTGAQLLVECLMEQEVEMGFGVPGESYLAVLDALKDVSNRFRFIGCRNEGGGAFMAEAYGKLTGKPGILFLAKPGRVGFLARLIDLRTGSVIWSANRVKETRPADPLSVGLATVFQDLAAEMPAHLAPY